ncbi:MAG: hypothetical protein Q8M94_03010, partial [Ignavibacteria bacterium]|nr:hypothetical protein [Ignavibacteria bacterium]
MNKVAKIQKCKEVCLVFNIKLMIILFLSTLLLGCESIPPPSHTPVVAPTVAATKENFASDNMSALASIEPIITGYRLRFDSWSADSKWIGYWVADGDNLPAHPGFVNSQSGESCLQKEIISSNLENGNISWADNNVYVLNRLNDTLFAGMPCETFSPIEKNFALDDPSKHISPNKQYQ